MKTVWIHQLGRLDRNFEKAISFSWNSSQKRAPLSSLAFRAYLEEKGKKVANTLFYPISLPFQPKCSQFQEEIWKNLSSYFQSPKKFLAKHPHSQQVEHFAILHSMGRYSYEGREISFSSSLDDITLDIFLEMLRQTQFGKNWPSEWYIDISSGQNIYNIALLEAFRMLILFHCFVFLTKEPLTKFFLLFSDPVIPSIEGFQLHIRELSIKVFFSVPPFPRIQRAEDIQEEAKKIYPDEEEKQKMRDKRKRLVSLIQNFLKLFHSIQKGVPLLVWYLFPPSPKEEEEKNF